MKVKQFAERMGVDIKSLEVEIKEPCKSCRKMGGTMETCVPQRTGGNCMPIMTVYVQSG